MLLFKLVDELKENIVSFCELGDVLVSVTVLLKELVLVVFWIASVTMINGTEVVLALVRTVLPVIVKLAVMVFIDGLVEELVSVVGLVEKLVSVVVLVEKLVFVVLVKELVSVVVLVEELVSVVVLVKELVSVVVLVE